KIKQKDIPARRNAMMRYQKPVLNSAGTTNLTYHSTQNEPENIMMKHYRQTLPKQPTFAPCVDRNFVVCGFPKIFERMPKTINSLQKNQENCEHQFTYDENFGRCVKCNKTDALYY